MTLPRKHLELVDRCWDALRDLRAEVDLALTSKGPTCDIIEGLSDIDLRVVLNTREIEHWRKADTVFADVFATFSHDHPEDWRIIEHTPGRGMATDELHRRTARSEILEWETIHESTLGLVPTATISCEEARSLYLEKFFAYRDPYDARRDPPINVAPRHLARFRRFSICWHYYVPALRCAAIAGGNMDVRSKWDALHWRAAAGSTVAHRALKAAEAAFDGPDDDLAEACTADIHTVARELTESDQPWQTIEQELPDLAWSQVDRLCIAIFGGRTVTGRWHFYINSAEGFDREAVLRIDRGHINTYLVGPVIDDSSQATLREYADDVAAYDQAVAFLMDQHRSTDMSKPRETFARLIEQYQVSRTVFERWYEDIR